MQTAVLAIHLLTTIALISVILIHRSEGGGLGVGGGNMGGFMNARGTANLLTRTTAVLAAVFMSTSLILAILSGQDDRTKSILDQKIVDPIAVDNAPEAPQEPAK